MKIFIPSCKYYNDTNDRSKCDSKYNNFALFSLEIFSLLDHLTFVFVGKILSTNKIKVFQFGRKRR